jgi:hypothetical protein
MSFYKVKHGFTHMFGKVCDVNGGVGHWTKFKSRICPYVIARNGIGVGVNVIFFEKNWCQEKKLGHFPLRCMNILLV